MENKDVFELETQKAKLDADVTTFIFPKRLAILSDPTFWSLLLSNLFVAGMVIFNNTPLRSVLFVYWVQSFIIGMFNFIRILYIKDFSANIKVHVNDTGIEEKDWKLMASTYKNKIKIAWFFLMHYGAFLFCFFVVILLSDDIEGRIVWGEVVLMAIAFFASHLFSFIRYFKEQTTKQNLGIVMISPYGRVFPMLLAIIAMRYIGGFAVAPFLLLKMVLDIFSHVIKHAPSVKNKTI